MPTVGENDIIDCSGEKILVNRTTPNSGSIELNLSIIYREIVRDALFTQNFVSKT